MKGKIRATIVNTIIIRKITPSPKVARKFLNRITLIILVTIITTRRKRESTRAILSLPALVPAAAQNPDLEAIAIIINISLSLITRENPKALIPALAPNPSLTGVENTALENAVNVISARNRSIIVDNAIPIVLRVVRLVVLLAPVLVQVLAAHLVVLLVPALARVLVALHLAPALLVLAVPALAVPQVLLVPVAPHLRVPLQVLPAVLVKQIYNQNMIIY